MWTEASVERLTHLEGTEGTVGLTDWFAGNVSTMDTGQQFSLINKYFNENFSSRLLRFCPPGLGAWVVGQVLLTVHWWDRGR